MLSLTATQVLANITVTNHCGGTLFVDFVVLSGDPLCDVSVIFTLGPGKHTTHLTKLGCKYGVGNFWQFEKGFCDNLPNNANVEFKSEGIWCNCSIK